MADVAPDPNLPVSHEVDGRILTGVGVTPEALAETMERHALELPDESATESPVAASTPPPPQEPKRSRGQRRFDELTREREDARREAEAAKKEAADLRAKLAAPPVSTPAPVSTPQPAPVSAPAAAAFTYPTYDVALAANPSLQWEDWMTDRSRAAAKFELDSRSDSFDAQIRTRIEADWASRAAAHAVEQTNARGRTAYPDFDAVLSQPHMQTPWPVEKIEAMNAIGNGEHLKYALGKNPDLAERLRTEPNMVKFGMELAALITPPRVASPASTPTGSPVVPAPYQPVGASSKTTAIPSSELPKRSGFDFDKSGYRERRAAERGIRR